MWQQLTINTDKEHVDAINDLLNLFEAQAITFLDAADEPLLEPELNTTPLWSHTTVKALFPVNFAVAKVIDFMQTQLGEVAIQQAQIDLIGDENWERAWLKNFKPMCFGKRLWICPSNTTPPDPHGVNIILDPGLAFGTGTHPTTALCLQWLDQHPPTEKTVIDYGCGSGILAIAALKLGAQKVWAVDHDPQALEATRDNAKRNQLTLKKLLVEAPENFADVKADVLIANILAKPLIDLAPRFATLVSHHGHVVLSGILADQMQSVIDAYRSWFQLEATEILDGWGRIVLRAS